MKYHRGCVLLGVILFIHFPIKTRSKAMKQIMRPVYEQGSDFPRIDIDKMRNVHPPPHHGNPLAGNPKLSMSQRLRIHAQNQQAMHNAEKTRKQRAQSKRHSTHPGTQMDSYMQAYQEEQDKHQRDVEIHQALLSAQIKHNPQPNQRMKPPSTIQHPRNRISQPQRPLKMPGRLADPETLRITKSDAVLNLKDANRNQRSHAPVIPPPIPQYIFANHPYTNNDVDQHTSYVTALPPTYRDQGVTINPHSNIGVKYSNMHKQAPPQASQQVSHAMASSAENVYLKPNQLLGAYKNVQDINALNALLSKPANDQLSGLHALLQTTASANDQEIALSHSMDSPHEDSNALKEVSNEPANHSVDLYVYAHDLDGAQPENYGSSENTYGYGSAYGYQDAGSVKDHIPITENVQDIEDTSKPKLLTAFGTQTVLQTERPKEATTGSSIYKYELTSHSLSDAVKTRDLYSDTSGFSSDGDNLHYASQYEFGYRVRDPHTGNDFGHHESKDGDTTKGHYHVLLPDGRLQNVKYWAGPSGYHAHVSYDQ